MAKNAAERKTLTPDQKIAKLQRQIEKQKLQKEILEKREQIKKLG